MTRYVLQAFVLLCALLEAGSSMGFLLTLPSTSVNHQRISRNAEADDYSDASTFASQSNPSPHKRDLAQLSSALSSQPSYATQVQTRSQPNSLPVNGRAVILPRSSFYRLRKRQGSLLKQEETIGLSSMPHPVMAQVTATGETARPIEKHDLPINDCSQKQRVSQSIARFDDPRQDSQKLESSVGGFLSRMSINRLGHVTTRRSSNIPVQDRRPALQIFIVRNIA